MKTITRQLLRTFIFILLAGSIFVVQGQVIKTFKPVYQQTQKGGIVFISNVATTCRIADTNAMPPSTGTSNNSYPSYYVDRDGDPTTFSSTSDSLVLPPCSQISFVGLYWGGYATAATTGYATRQNIKIKANNNSYIDVSSTWDTTYVGGSFTTYHCYRDITGIFQAYGNNTRYTVANVIGATTGGGNNRFAGWNIVIVYKNDLQNMRQLTVFNGLSNIQSGNIDIPVTGFLTPPTGPVTFEMGVFCYDGDRGTTGDQLLFNGAGSYVNISDAINVTNNVFNSTISRNGVLTPYRKPSYNNNFSIDADIFFPNNAAKNYIGNSATSCTLRQTTSGDVYLTQTVTLAIDVYSPDNRTAVKVEDINGGLTVPGDTLLYTVTCKNIGSDPSINTYVIDSLEGNIDYIPGSINITVGPNSGAKTDVAGDDQAEYDATGKRLIVRIGTGANAVTGGQVNDSPFGNDSTLFTFKSKVVSNCDVLYCDNIVDNSAFIIGTGVVSGIEYTNASNPNIFDAYGCPIPGATKTVITAAQCPQYPDTSLVACSHQNFNVLYTRPGFTFYNTSWVSVVKPSAAGTYYGVHPIGIYCLDTVVITVSSYVFCNGPTANDDNGPALTEDGANGTVNVISNDTDADGNPTAPVNGAGEFTVDLDPGTPGVQSTFTDPQGVWTLNTATGEVTFDPADNYFGTATIPYTLCDPSVLCDNANITFVVGPVNDPPVANDDNGPALTEDGPNGQVNIITNDTDVDGNPSAPVNGVGQFSVDLDPGTAGIQTTFTDAQGVWTLNTATGEVTFDPANNYNGTAVIPYTLCDPAGACDNADITFVVTPVNDPPVANDDNGAGLTEDGPNGTVNILTNDTDPDGNPTAPVNGVGQFIVDLDPGTAGIQTTFTDAQGVWTLNTATGEVTFDPADNYFGTATIPYTLCDPSVLCDNANITFVVGPVNDPPVANDDNGPALTEDGPNGTVNVITNDTDLDGNPTAPVNGVGQFTVDLDPGTPGIQTTFIDAQGVWTLNTATGVVTFDPANDFNGTAVIPYTLCDLAGACDNADITFVVTPVNDPPVANDDNGAGLTEDGPNGTVSILTNDTDPDGNPTAPVNGVGQFIVDLDPGTAGIQTTFTDAQGVWTLNTATGVVTFDPANDYNGTAVIPYTLCDPSGLCDPANITFVVAPVNDPPVANDDNGPALTEDGPNGTINVITNDTDLDGNPTAPVNGVGQFTVDLDPGTPGIQTTFTDAQGVWTLNTATGEVTFDPANNYNGTATIPYTLCDPSGACDNADISFVVTPVNDPPVANDDNGAGLTEDGPDGTVNIITNDTDPDGNPSAPVNGVGQFTVDLDPGTAGIQTTFTDAQGVWTLNTATGDVTFNPANNYDGTAVIPYSLCDPSGACDPATITFVVSPVNDPPVANDDNGPALNEDGPNGTVNVITNDTDLDGNPAAPVNGVGQFTVDLDPGTPGIQTTFTDAQGVWTLNTATGEVTFDPANNYNGTAVIPYTLCDPAGACDNANISFVVTAVNDPPLAINDVGAQLIEDGANGSVSLLSNDSDPDGNPSGPVNGPGQFTIDLDPITPGLQTSFTDSQGVWTLNTTTGEVTFDPANNYNGTAVLPYRLCDPTGLCDDANISFDVLPQNDPPVVADDNASTNEDTPVTFNIAANDFDVDGPMDPTTIDLDPASPGQQTLLIVPGEGTYILNPSNGDVTFIPYANFNGTTTPVPYSICDSGIPLPVNCDQANITVTVIAVNDPPVANDNAANTDMNTPVTFNIITNDFDIDGAIDPATIDLDPSTPGNQTSFTIPGQGTYTVNTSIGDVTFTPALNFSGIVTPITYSVCDNGTPLPALCDQAIINMEVILTNIAPVANDDGATTPEDTPVTFSITGNDTDADGVIDPSTIDLDPSTPGNQTTFTIPGQGTYVANTTTGEVTFTPALNFNGAVNTITYSVCDNGIPVYCDQATIDLNVTAVNDAPVVNLNTVSTSEETPVTFNVIGNDTDIEGFVDPASIDLDQSTPGNQTTLTIPGEGTYTANTTTGEVTFTPDLNFNGQATPIIYSACDNNLPAACDTAFISIFVNGVNDPPVADPDNFTINEDNTLNATVIANDSDVDNNLIPTGFAIVTGTSNGTLNFSNNGTFTYTPNTDYTGTDTFIYTVCDLGMPIYCDTALVTINVLPVNDPPVIVEPPVVTPEDTPVTVCTTISDPDAGNTFTASLCGPPANGAITSGPAIVGNQVCFTYLPNNNFSGTDNVCIIVCDNTGLCDTSTSVITVVPVNDPLVANPDNFTTNEDTPITGTVINNDSDLDGNLNPNGFAVVSYPTNGTLIFSGNGTFTYTPDPGYSGTDSFIYSICDLGMPIYCDTALVTINVLPVNDPPIAVDDIVTTPEDTPVSGSVITNDSDPEGDALTVVDFTINGTTYPAGTTVTIPGVGVIVIDSTGNYTFTPDPDYNGPVPTITYTITDGNGGTDQADLDIFVGMVNDPPVAVNDTISTPEDTPVSGNALTNDSDIDGGPLSIVSFIVNGVTYPAGATVNIPGYGVITIYSNGLFNFVPAADFNGSVPAIPYTITDGSGGLATADIIITVTPVDDPPVIQEPPVVTPEDTPVTVCTTINDPDAGNTFTASLCGPPANGTITSGPTVVGNQVCFTYLPNTNFNGTDNVCIIVCDNTGLCDTSTSVITVVPVNDPLVANPDNFTTNEDTPITGTVINNDSDVDGNLNPTGFAIVTGPSNGTIIFSSNGTFTYTPNPDYIGTDTFIYMVCDLGMPIYCGTALVTIDVLPVDDPPVIPDLTVTTPEDTPITVCLPISDPDANSIFTASLCGSPSNGTITAGPTVIGNQVCVTYMPNPDFNGTDQVCITICDNSLDSLLCDNGIITINVLPVNDPPIANADNFTTNEDTPITGTVINNDSDVDGNLNPTGFAIVTGPSNGTINFSNNGTFTYTPNPNYNGTDNFIYMICDFGMPINCDTALVTINVLPVNDVPIVFNEQISLCEGSSASVNVLLNGDFDPEATILTVETDLVSGPMHGNAVITAGGVLTYTPTGGYFGTDYVVVSLCDQGIPLPSVCSNDTVFITVDQDVIAFAGYDQQFCDDDLDFFTLTGNDMPFANVQWTQISGPPVIITNANSSIAAAFINHTPGTYVFEYSVTNGTCTASSQVTYSLWLPPSVADAGPDQNLCGAIFTTITATTPVVGTGVWAQVSGPDTANIIDPNQPSTIVLGLIPGTYVFSWTVSNGPYCDPSIDYVEVTITAPTTAFAGPNATICEGSNFTMSDATATNAVSVQWTTSGTGQFNISNILNPFYIPSPNDILDGYVYLTLTATANAPCPDVSSTMTLFISHHAIVNAGPDDIICSTQGSYTLSGSSSQNAVSYQWTTSGTGTFFDGATLHPVYTPSLADIAAGAVTLTVVATSPSPCPSVSDNMVLTISPQAIANAGADAAICESDTYTLNGATALYGTSYLWTSSGTGTFDNTAVLNPIYTPSLNDILDGQVDLTLTVTSTAPCTTASDVMTLTINHRSIVNAGPDAIICETQGSYTVSGSSSQYAVGYAWTTSGTGTFTNGNTLHPVYTPSPADITFGSVILTVVANSASPCPGSTDAMILTISRQAVISAGTDATICETGTYPLGGSTAQFATGLIWSTSGTGSFNNPNILHPVYTPSLNDIQDGFVFLTLTANSASPCTMVTDVMRLNISHQVSNVYAGADATICETATYTLSDATELNATSVLWTTSGTGTFNNNTLLHATYDPSPADVAAGSVTLTLTANSAIPCPSVSDAMILYFSLQAVSSAGPDGVVCEGSSFTLNGATATNATSYIWTTSGSGTFADPSILNAVYTPSAADILNGSITLTLITTSQAPCGNAPADAMLLTISHKPVIYAGADTAICQNVSYFVDDATALYSTSLFWTTTGAGTILNGNTLNPTYVPGPGETGVIMLTLNAISSVACGSDTITDFMYLTIMESIIANAGQDTTIFANNSVTLHGSATNGSGAYSYNWEPATLLVFENTDHPITDPLSTTTIFVVTVTDLVTGCQDQDTVVITVDGINLPPVAVDDYDTTEYQTCITFPILPNDYDPDSNSLTVSLCGPPVNGTVVLNSDNTLTYCPYDGFSGEDSLCYQICDNGSPVLCDQATVYIHVKPEFTLDDLIIYNGVSPNGDGDNDVWIIFGIEFFPDNEVTIFNRWGDVIANYTHYNNNDVSWDATYKGKQVPDGTYYYMLDIKNKKKFAGWIYVKTGK